MDSIFKRAKYLRSVGDIKGAEAIERFIETRRKAFRFFADDPQAKAWADNLRGAKRKLERIFDE